MKRNREITAITNASEKGDGEFNEDRVGWTGSRAWVIDGGTDIAETFRPQHDRSGAAWIAESLSATLAHADSALAVPIILSSFASSVRTTLHSLGAGSGDVPPICSVAIVERSESGVRVSRVGDVTVYVPSLGALVAESQFGINEGKGVVADSATGSSSILARRIGYLQGESGLWVLGDNPGIDRGVYEVDLAAYDPIEVMIVSDGFARAVSPYEIYADYGALFRAVRSQDARSVLRRIRAFETGKANRDNHYKKKDDASILIVQV